MKLCWSVSAAAAVTAVIVSWSGMSPDAARYALHGVLFSLLLAATLTDLREMIIPDSITLPGTLLALTLTTLLPLTALPVTDYHITTIQQAQPRGFATPEITAKPGVLRYNSPAEIHAASTSHSMKPHIAALISSLIGIAVGAGMIWGVRIVGSMAMGREAMGFGDVTLMGMIGAFLGWQPCVAIFFLAPFAGLAFVAVQRIARPKLEPEIPYGPFLCGGTVLTVLGWQYVWERLEPVVELGIFLPLTLLVGLALLGVILAVWQKCLVSRK